MPEQPSVSRRLNTQLVPGAGVVRPVIAGGGAGGGTTVVDGGGPTLAAVQVQLIFWGASWNATPSPSIASIQRDIITILDSPYMSALDQYKGVGAGALLGTTLVTTSDPPNPFNDSDVTKLVTALLQGGTLPEPDDNTQILYCVIMPANVRSTKFAQNSITGEHSTFSYSDVDPAGTQNVTAHWAWLTHDGTIDDLTTIFSHELVESCTDPEGSAIQLNAPGTCTANPTNWCEIGDVCSGTSGLVCGVRVQAYWSARDNACVIPGGVKSGQATGNPALIQGRFEHRGNFEMVVPLASGGLAHYDRANDLPFVPWFGPNDFAADVGELDAVTLIQSNFTTGAKIGDLEVVARFGQDLLFFAREDTPPYIWHGPFQATGFQQMAFSGNPVLIEGRFGKVGNFEMVVPLASGGLAHYDRANDLPGTPWFGPEVFATDVGPLDAVTMIQSNFTAGPGIGNLEVVARFGEDLLFFWREDVPPYVWHGPTPMIGSSSRLLQETRLWCKAGSARSATSRWSSRLLLAALPTTTGPTTCPAPPGSAPRSSPPTSGRSTR